MCLTREWYWAMSRRFQRAVTRCVSCPALKSSPIRSWACGATSQPKELNNELNCRVQRRLIDLFALNVASPLQFWQVFEASLRGPGRWFRWTLTPTRANLFPQTPISPFPQFFFRFLFSDDRFVASPPFWHLRFFFRHAFFASVPSSFSLAIFFNTYCTF